MDTVKKSDETLLAAFERKMLRRILGPVCVEGQWRSRYNDELYELYGDLTVVQRIMAGITDWQTKARDRERFRTLLRQAKTAKRLYRRISK